MMKGANQPPSAYRVRKKDCPGGQWPNDFPWVRYSESDCLAGLPAQDHLDLPRHYRSCHPGIVYDSQNLVKCTREEYLNYINEQNPMPGHARRLKTQPSVKDKSIASRPAQLRTIRQAFSTLTTTSYANNTIAPVASSTTTPMLTTSATSTISLLPPAIPSALAHSSGDRLNLRALPLSNELDTKPLACVGTKRPSELVSVFDLIMASDSTVRKRRGKADRIDSEFRGYGCYIRNCDFVSTGKNALSSHLGRMHGLNQNAKELDKIKLINDPKGNDLPTISSSSALCAISETLVPSSLSRTIAKPPRTALTAPQAQRPPQTQRTPQVQCSSDNPVTFVDPLPPWYAPGALPKSIRAKFDHTRLPIFYKCYVERCDVLGREPSNILKHWQAYVDCGDRNDNPTHVGHLWDIDLVFKFIREKDGNVRVTTHGKDPLLPTKEMLDPKNVKQYLAPLEHTNVAMIKVRSTASTSECDADQSIWSCTLCDAKIGNLRSNKEHVADCHGYMIQNHNDGTRKIHILAAHADANGETECHMPDEVTQEQCGYVESGDILQHLADEHDLPEDKILDNEETGRIWLTVAEVR